MVFFFHASPFSNKSSYRGCQQKYFTFSKLTVDRDSTWYIININVVDTIQELSTPWKNSHSFYLNVDTMCRHVIRSFRASVQHWYWVTLKNIDKLLYPTEGRKTCWYCGGRVGITSLCLNNRILDVNIVSMKRIPNSSHVYNYMYVIYLYIFDSISNELYATICVPRMFQPPLRTELFIFDKRRRMPSYWKSLLLRMLLPVRSFKTRRYLYPIKRMSRW